MTQSLQVKHYEEEWVLLHRVEHRQQNCWTCDEVELSLIQLQGHYTVFHG